MRRFIFLALLAALGLSVAGDASADFSLQPAIVDGSSWRFSDRRTVSCNPTSTVAGGFTCTAQAPTCIAAGGGTVAASSGTNRQYTSFLTNAANNAIGGCDSSGSVTRPGFRPIKYQRVLTDTALTLRRVWHGLTRATWTLVPVRTAADGAAACPAVNQDGALWGFDTAVDASWMLCSCDTTNYSCVDSGIDVAISTEYQLLIDLSVSGTLRGCVNGACFTKTTNLPASGVLSFQDTITTLDGTGRTLYLGQMEVTQQ